MTYVTLFEIKNIVEYLLVSRNGCKHVFSFFFAIHWLCAHIAKNAEMPIYITNLSHSILIHHFTFTNHNKTCYYYITLSLHF